MFRADQPDSTKYHQLFFQSPVLPEAAHVLTITYEGDQTDPLFLDYFTVDEATISASSLTTTSSSSSSSVPLSTSTTPIPTPPTPTPTPPTPVIVTITSTAVAGGLDANASSSPSAVSGASTGHAGAVAGGIIGGIAVLFLAAFAFIMWRRRRSKNRNPYNFKDHNGTCKQNLSLRKSMNFDDIFCDQPGRVPFSTIRPLLSANPFRSIPHPHLLHLL